LFRIRQVIARSPSICLGTFPSSVIRGKFGFGEFFFRRVGLGCPLANLGDRQAMQFTYNEALQLTAQSAAALWVPSAGFACSGGN